SGVRSGMPRPSRPPAVPAPISCLGIVRVHQTNGVLRLDAHRPALPVHDPAGKPSEPRWRFEPFHLHLVATPSDWQIAHENRPLAGHDFPLLSRSRLK